MSIAFHNGDGVIVSARGPGKLHLISYASNHHNVVNHAGDLPTKANTTEKDVTRFLISHSYTFEKFAFYWEGNGEAVCGIGHGMTRVPVGKSWKRATTIAWGGQSFGTNDVTEEVEKSVPKTSLNCYFIPQ